MRTTVTFDDDVAAAIEQFRRDQLVGLSEAVNDLIRAGMVRKPEREAFSLPTYPMGIKVDVANVAEVLDMIDEADRTV